MADGPYPPIGGITVASREVKHSTSNGHCIRSMRYDYRLYFYYGETLHTYTDGQATSTSYLSNLQYLYIRSICGLLYLTYHTHMAT